MYQAITLSAGVAVEFTEPADFFRVLEATPTDLELTFYVAGREIGRAENIAAGYAEKFAQAFDKLRIKSAAGGDLEFVARLGSDVRYDKAPTGAVTVANLPTAQGAFTQSPATVTTASAQLKAANASRRYLLVQNNDASGIVYLNLAGAAATTANGVKLMPGASIELQGYLPTGQINAIGSIASNANVIVLEG